MKDFNLSDGENPLAVISIFIDYPIFNILLNQNK